MRKELEEQVDTVEAMTQESSKLRGENEVLKLRAAKVDLDFNRMKRAMQLDEKEAQVNHKLTLGLNG